MTTDSLEAELAGLLVEPPAPLADRVVSGWVRVPGLLGPMYVALTDRGINFTRPASTVDDDPGRFAAEYREQFGRPVRPVAEVPRPLLRALRDGRTGDLDYDLRGLTDFERAVLGKTLEIPRGEIRPYSWIAAEIGRPAAVRATGSALGRNPVPLLIPCHRVVRGDGVIGNYGFGTQMKRDLLAAEAVDLEECRRLAAAHIRYLASATGKVFCYPTCRHARRIAPSNRVGFPTLARAVDTGHRPCQDCRPH